MSDGEWQEGSNWEALIFARHNALTNLTLVIDENGLQGFGATKDVASMDALAEKFSGFGLNVATVDGHHPENLRAALDVASSAGPRIVILQTVKGHGVSFMENAMEWHYLAMSAEQYQAALEEIGKPTGAG